MLLFALDDAELKLAKGSLVGLFLVGGGGSPKLEAEICTGEAILLIFLASACLLREVFPPRLIFIVWPDYKKRGLRGILS